MKEIAVRPNDQPALKNLKRRCLGTVATLTVDQDGYAQREDPAGLLSLVTSYLDRYR